MKSAKQAKLRKRIIYISLITVFLVMLSAILTFDIFGKSQCSKKCNVLLISADSLRADHLSSFGYARDTSNNFDALAKKGTLFKNFFSNSYLTPVSEMTVHTGLYPFSNGVTSFNKTLPSDKLTIAQYMKKLGYRTEASVYSPEFSAQGPLKDNFSRGFDVYQYDPIRKIEKDRVVDRTYPSFDTLEKALARIKNSNKPSFFWLALGGIHWPYGEGAPNTYDDPNYKGIFKDKQLALPILSRVYKDILYPSKKPLSKADVQHITDKYDNGIKEFDNFLGEVIRQLKASGLFDKTIIVIQSEHGEELGEHGYYMHYDVLDNQVHTPLLIFDPRQKGGSASTDLTSSVDILPTILDLVGLKTQNNFDGKSLAPLISKKTKYIPNSEVFIQRVPLWEESVAQALDPNASEQQGGNNYDLAIRSKEWMYIKRTAKSVMKQISWFKRLTGLPLKFEDAELYDLANDPEQYTNVADKYPDVVTSLDNKLRVWFENEQSKIPRNQKQPGLIQPYQ